MPIYEYLCSGCGSKFELLRRLDQANDEASCPTCHSPAQRRLSVFACFTKGESGESTPVAGTGSSCAGCSSTSCGSCGL